jgi:hypothetical protein
MTNISQATSVRNKIFLWPSLRSFWKRMLKLPSVSESPEITDITPPSDPPEVEPIISLNALTGFSAPQTLKLIGYIKHQKVIILVDSGNHR